MRPRDWLLLPLAAAVAIAGLLWGTKNSYTSLRNRSPVEVTCAQFEATPVDAQWVRFRDCVLDFDHMGVETSTNKYGGETVTAVYIPLRSPSLRDSTPAKLVLAIDEGPLLAFGGRSIARPDIDAWIVEARRYGVPGLIELGVDRSERKKKRMREIGLHTEHDPAIVVYAGAPRPLALALGVLVAGLGALGWLVWRLWPRRREAQLPRAQIVQT